MKTQDLSGNSSQLTRFGMVNAFLVKEEDGLTLVDTMIRGSGEKLIEAAAPFGAPITRIVVTHAHDDHVGSLAAVSRSLPGAEVVVPRRDAKLIRGDKAGEPGEPDGRLLGGYPAIDVTIDREVVEGDSVGSLKVIDTPGHTPGHISLLDQRDGVLIAGDAFSTLGGVATSAGPYWRFPLPGFATWHRPTALESARKLRALDPAVLAVGHGSPVGDPGAKMQAAIDARS